MPESMPNVVFIYRFPGPDEPFAPALRTVLIQSQAVRAAKWNPVRKGSLGICCGNSSIYTWSDEWITEVGGEAEEMAECIGVPARKISPTSSNLSQHGHREIRYERFFVGARWERNGTIGQGYILLCL